MTRLLRTALIALSLVPLTTLVGCSLFRRQPDIAPVEPADPGNAANPETDEIRCAVSGKIIPKGEQQFRYVYRGKTYHFSDEECRELFKNDPEKYLPLANR